MPRAKYDETNPYNYLFTGIGFFKVNYADFLYDFRYIYKDILDFFGDSISFCEEKIKKRLDIILKANVKPTLKNRFYIVTNICDVVLAVVDMDDDVFDNLIQTFEIEDEYNAFSPDVINACYITNMYLFKDNKLVKIHPITSYRMAQFMAVFKNENIVNYQGARDYWYAKPRREAKRKNQPNSFN